MKISLKKMREEAAKQGFSIMHVGENGTDYSNTWFVEKDYRLLSGPHVTEREALDWLFAFTGTLPGYKDSEGPLLGPWMG